MCDPCHKRIVAFYTFQLSAQNHATNLLKQHCLKRLLSTPSRKSPKRSRVDEQILSSLEKVKETQNDASTQNPTRYGQSSIVDQLISSVEKMKLKNEYEECQRKARKSLFQSEGADEDDKELTPLAFHSSYSVAPSRNEGK